MISLEQESECIRLYKEESLTIKQIMAETGIKSEQTIYRILNDANIPRRPARNSVKKTTVSFDQDAMEVIAKYNPKNLSEFICKAIVAFDRNND